MSAAIKIVRILNRPTVGGHIFHVVAISKILNKEIDAHLLVGQVDQQEADGSYILDDAGVSYSYVKNMKRSINPFQDLFALAEIVRFIRKEKPHIIETHAAKAGTLGRLAGVICKTPVILHTFHGHVFHSYFSQTKTKLILVIERWLAKKSTKIIAISNFQKEELANVYNLCPAEKIEVIPLGLDLAKFTENQASKKQQILTDWNIPKNTLIFSIVGRLTAIKNQKLFIELIAEVKKQYAKPIMAFVIGEGELFEDLNQQAKSLGLETSIGAPEKKVDIIFTKVQKNVDAFLSATDIIFLTSDNEGTPVTLIEAEANGIPIISTKVGGIPDVVENEFNALLSPPKELNAMVTNTLKMIDNYDFYKSNALVKQDKTVKFYGQESLEKRMKEFYNRISGKKI